MIGVREGAKYRYLHTLLEKLKKKPYAAVLNVKKHNFLQKLGWIKCLPNPADPEFG